MEDPDDHPIRRIRPVRPDREIWIFADPRPPISRVGPLLARGAGRGPTSNEVIGCVEGISQRIGSWVAPLFSLIVKRQVLFPLRLRGEPIGHGGFGYGLTSPALARCLMRFSTSRMCRRLSSAEMYPMRPASSIAASRLRLIRSRSAFLSALRGVVVSATDGSPLRADLNRQPRRRLQAPPVALKCSATAGLRLIYFYTIEITIINDEFPTSPAPGWPSGGTPWRRRGKPWRTGRTASGG